MKGLFKGVNKKFTKGDLIVVALLLVCFIVSFIKFTTKNAAYEENKYTLIKPEKIATEYSRKQYEDTIDNSRIEYKLNTTTARVALILSTLVELDAENKAFSSTQFTNGLLYCDWVLHGDKIIKFSQNLEGKFLILNNAIGIINSNIDDINVFIYSLGNNRLSYNFIWEDINSDIEELNELISEYNNKYDTEYVHIHEIKDIYPNVSAQEKKHIKELYNGN